MDTSAVEKISIDGNNSSKQSILANELPDSVKFPEIESTYNDLPVKLVYNEDMLLLKRNCELVLKFPAALNNWVLKIVFTDSVSPDGTKYQSKRTFENGNRTIVLTQYGWTNSVGAIETVTPHTISSNDKAINLLIRISSQANSNNDVRTAHISIWQIMTT